MAQLISCPACSKNVSSMAHACPGCGHPIANTNQQSSYRPYQPRSSTYDEIVSRTQRERDEYASKFGPSNRDEVSRALSHNLRNKK